METPEKQEIKPKMDLDSLPVILEYLDSIGMTTTVHNLEEDKKYLISTGMPMPLVRDGGDAIRASYDKKSGRLEISFTNVFDEPDHPQRKQVQEWLDSNFDQSE